MWKKPADLYVNNWRRCSGDMDAYRRPSAKNGKGAHRAEFALSTHRTGAKWLSRTLECAHPNAFVNVSTDFDRGGAEPVDRRRS